MKKDTIAVLIICIILVALSVPLGMLWGKYREDWIAETYFKEFKLTRDVVFDESEIVDFYGEPLKFPAGTKGSIVEGITGGIEVKGYEYINIHITAENGKGVDAAISIDPDSEKGIYTLKGDIYGVVAVFSLNDIEDHETILAEYKDMHERYYAEAKATRKASVVCFVAISLVLSCIIGLVVKNHAKAE